MLLAGGRGERFWPLSQPALPKQFLSLFNDRPLLVQTVERTRGYFTGKERFFIIPRELKRLTRKYVGGEQIIVEPVRRNTAPAICLAAMVLRRRFGNGIMHVMPADHVIEPKAAFISALKYGARLAEQGYLVTYGIRPDRPETGYGYVRLGRKIGLSGRNRAYAGAGFTEKPNAARARQYVRRHYLWNSGIFTFSIETVLGEIEHFVPDVYRGVERFLARGRVSHFAGVPDISIDYGIMEKSRRLCVVEGRFAWDDVGSWLALERYFKPDRRGNVMIGDARGIEIADSIMVSRELPLRAYGVTGMIVVVSRHGVLVCPKERAQDLKELLKLNK